LGVAPERCLVFEDSIAGVHAAKAAGARCIVLSHASKDIESCRRFADGVITHFEELPENCWQELASSSASGPSLLERRKHPLSLNWIY